jgi:hypothetical protein
LGVRKRARVNGEKASSSRPRKFAAKTEYMIGKRRVRARGQIAMFLLLPT